MMPPASAWYAGDGVTIYRGDCREVASHVAADVVITDPPYGFRHYKTDDDSFTGEVLAEWVARFRTVAVFGYPELLVRRCAQAGVEPAEWVTWWPTNAALMGRARASLLPREVECIAIFGRVVGAQRLTRPRRANASMRRVHADTYGYEMEGEARLGDVWTDAAPGVASHAHLRQHPNEKPISLMHKLVLLCSEPGEVILDPFCGSGTTLRAAKDHGRKAVGVEIDLTHCETAANRMAQAVLSLEMRSA